jgi:hypothetical protein
MGMTTTELAYDSKEYAANELRKLFPPGSTARTILRHVSASGMTRWISVIADTPDGPHDVSHWVARIMGEHANRGKYEGIRVGGCGMDMGFSLVYSMSRILYRDGFTCRAYKRGALVTPGPGSRGDNDPYYGLGDARGGVNQYGHAKRQCPANDHVNYRSHAETPYRHRDGGYAVSHQWL